MEREKERLGWHLFALLVRLAGGLAFLWLARLLWPQHKTGSALLTILYLVYPGFLEQPIAATYINRKANLFGIPWPV